MVFDDLSLFSGNRFSYYAATPFDFNLRVLPYFTLAFPQVMWGYFPPWHHAEIHRAISLVFHIACALALLKLLTMLLAAVEPRNGISTSRGPSPDACLLAIAGAAVFALHPVAVYGAAYLVQRTILLATLFSLLSLIVFMHGMVARKQGYAIGAALLYSLAVFSKEHSLLLPATAILMLPLMAAEKGFLARYTATYVLACMPAAIGIVVLARGVVGRAYEPGFDMLLSQIEGVPHLEVAGGPWLVSMVTQAGLFFKYLALWLAPHTEMMSIDMRVDFAQTWTPGWIAIKLLSYLGVGVLALMLLLKRGRIGLAGFGILYLWLMYTIEFTSVRFQEPFVLYRSYLWAPGIVVAAVALLRLVSNKIVLVFFIVTIPILFYQAQDRLRSFSSALALWEDAAAKLPAHPVPWASRTLFGLAGELVYSGRLEEAMSVAKRCIAHYPETSYCYFSKGAIHMYRNEYTEALAYIDRSLAIHPRSGIANHHRGLIMERTGHIEQAKEYYRRAYELGFIGGLYRLGVLEGRDERLLYGDVQTPAGEK